MATAMTAGREEALARERAFVDAARLTGCELGRDSLTLPARGESVARLARRA